MIMMRLGMFTSGYQRNSLEDAFIDAKRFGYDYIELWGGRPHAFAPDLAAGQLADVLALSKKYSIPIAGYTPEHNAYPYNFMIGTETMRQDSIHYLELCLDMAARLGSDYMLISPAHAGYDTSYKMIRERLYRSVEELTRHAEKVGVKLVVEPLTTYETNVLKSANELAELLDNIDSPNLVGMCDIVPPFQQHEQIMSYFNLLGEKMYHMHIIDSDGTSDSHIMPGEGILPLPELLQELKELPYEGTATIELVTGYINEPRLYAKRAIENIREILS